LNGIEHAKLGIVATLVVATNTTSQELQMINKMFLKFTATFPSNFVVRKG